MSKLSLKTLRRNNLPYGKFTYMIALRRSGANTILHSTSNASTIEKMRGFLDTTCRGESRLVFEMNRDRRRVYTYLYLQEPMDLALLKLSFPDEMFKIYKITLGSYDESA